MAPLDDKTAEEKILAALAAASEPQGYRAIITATGIHDAQAARVIDRLVLRNVVLKTNGRYTVGRSRGGPVTVTTIGTITPGTTAPVCRVCGVELKSPENWWPSYQKVRNYLCSTCSTKKGKGQAPKVSVRGSLKSEGEARAPALTQQPPASALAVRPSGDGLVQAIGEIELWIAGIRLQRQKSILVEYHVRELKYLLEGDRDE